MAIVSMSLGEPQVYNNGHQIQISLDMQFVGENNRHCEGSKMISSGHCANLLSIPVIGLDLLYAPLRPQTSPGGDLLAAPTTVPAAAGN
jgi:hypothetical protein